MKLLVQAITYDRTRDGLLVVGLLELAFALACLALTPNTDLGWLGVLIGVFGFTQNMARWIIVLVRRKPTASRLPLSYWLVLCGVVTFSAVISNLYDKFLYVHGAPALTIPGHYPDCSGEAVVAPDGVALITALLTAVIPMVGIHIFLKKVLYGGRQTAAA